MTPFYKDIQEVENPRNAQQDDLRVPYKFNYDTIIGTNTAISAMPSFRTVSSVHKSEVSLSRGVEVLENILARLVESSPDFARTEPALDGLDAEAFMELNARIGKHIENESCEIQRYVNLRKKFGKTNHQKAYPYIRTKLYSKFQTARLFLSHMVNSHLIFRDT